MIYETVLARLIADQKLKLNDEILVICGGKFDREVLLAAGLKNVTITNLDVANSDYIAPYKLDRHAENLTYPDDSLDVVIDALLVFDELFAIIAAESDSSNAAINLLAWVTGAYGAREAFHQSRLGVPAGCMCLRDIHFKRSEQGVS